MNEIFELHHVVEREWAKSSGSLDSFPALATRLLRELTCDLSLEEFNGELAEWLLQPGPLASQIQLHNVFGQPPITLFNNGKFLVELYVWQNFDTSLHSHGFRGAFRVLYGSSLHEEFRPQLLERVSDDVQITRLGPPRRERLSPGYVGTILPGQDLTHRVIHLDHPTITLCVKTINESNLFQWNYFENGLAIQKRTLSERLIKSIYYFDYLLHQNEDQAADFWTVILGQLPRSTTMNLYEEIALSGLDLSEAARHLILESIADTYGAEKWFQLYQAANLDQLTHLDFSDCNVSLGRLAGHMINTNDDQGWEGNRLEAVMALFESPRLFHLDFNEEDRDEITRLVLNPGESVASHWPKAQIEKLRRFLAQ